MFTYKNRPIITLELKQFSEPAQILRWMRELNIQFYVYWFKTQDGTVLKYGESGDCESGEHGERIYRQAGHLPGYWLTGSSGEDMSQILKDFEEEYGKRLTKNEVVICVMPMNGVLRGEIKEVCELIERDLINEHIRTHDRPPIGNKDYETYHQWRKHMNTKRLSKFVEFEDEHNLQ